MPNIMITGANRGLGLEFVRQYLEKGWRVYATCRSPENAPELMRLAAGSQNQISLHPLDVTNSLQIKNLEIMLKAVPLDILLNNAGIYGPSDANFGNTPEDQWLDVLRVNCIAPMKIIEGFADNVARSDKKRIASVSSLMGSMEDNTSGGSYLYRSSKAALNAVMKSVSIDLKSRGITAVVLHPGWVKTAMGGAGAQISAQESVQCLIRILDKVTLADSGHFFNLDGTVLPW